MGIIKLKRTTEESAEREKTFEAGPTVTEALETPQWDDPAILKEDEAHIRENSRHYFLNNGTAKSIISAEAVNYFDEDKGEWRKIDNSFSETEEDFEAKLGRLKTKVKKPKRGKKVEVSGKSVFLSWEYLGKKQSDVHAEPMPINLEAASETTLKVERSIKGEMGSIGGAAVYENIEKDTDLEYKIQGNNVKENIIVKERSEEYKYLFALKTEGLKLRLSENNENLELYSEIIDDSGEIREKRELIIPSPYMYDAQGNTSEDVYYELEPEAEGKYVFAVVADANWINADDRIFPVVIDPQIITQNPKPFFTHSNYRRPKSGSSSSGTASWGIYGNSLYITAGKDAVYDYKSSLRIKKEEIEKLYDVIASVKFKIRVSAVRTKGYFNIDGNELYCEDSLTYITVDITNLYKSNLGDFYIDIMPSNRNYGNKAGLFDFYATGSYAPTLEIEYLTNEMVRSTKKSISLAGVMTGEVDLGTRDFAAEIVDVPADASVMGIGISHVYKKSAEDYHVGDNLRLSLNESFVKYGGSDFSNVSYLYTDAKGNKHGFKDYYYYLDSRGKKVYITESKSEITVNVDGRLEYNGHEVFTEYKSRTGLKAITEIEGISGSHLLSQRSDEYKQLEQQVESYKNAYEEFVVVNKNDIDSFDVEKTISEEEIFKDYTDDDSIIFLPKSEAIQYKSLKNQLQSLESSVVSSEIVPNTSSINAQLISLKSSFYESTLLLRNYVQNCSRQDVDLDPIKLLLGKIDENTLVEENYYQFLSDAYIYHEFREGDRGGTMSGSAIKAQLRQRNLLLKQIEQLNEKIGLNDISSVKGELKNQKDLLIDQIAIIDSKQSQYIYQLQSYYKEYRNKSEELEQMKRQMPINFLTDGQIIKGYNENGKLVAIYDNYENYAVIEYEKGIDAEEKIVRIYDNNGKSVEFSYNPSNQLTGITDTRGRRIAYTYGSSSLTISYDTGKRVTLEFSGDNLSSVKEEKCKLKTKLTYSGNVLIKAAQYSLVSEIGLTNSSEKETLQSTLEIAYKNGYTTLTEGAVRERYYFNQEGNCTEYRKEENGVVTEAEQYEYVPYWKGTTKQTNPRNVIKQAEISTLNKKSLENYTFSAGDTETTTLDSFNNPLKSTTNARKLNVDGSNTETKEIEYMYDENQRLIEEKAIVTYKKNSNAPYIGHRKYNYNGYGKVVKTESWVEGEETTRGKEVEESEYDEKGNIVRAYTYNSLDSASKLYTESEYNENGQILSESDETGENKVKYEYVSGTNLIRNEELPNGSKIGYGYGEEDEVTSITQSTEEGEENSNQKIYRDGEVIEVRSGDTVVKYSYDYKRRIKNIYVNGETPYESIEYTDDTTESGVSGKVDKAELTNAKGEKFMTVKDKSGRVVKTKYNGTEQAVYTYTEGKLTGIEDKETNETHSYEYDGLNRETKHSFGGKSKTTSYGDYGEESGVTLTYGSGDTVTYGYEYTNDSAKELKKVSVSGVEESYERDELGRKKKVTQNLGTQTYSKRYRYYKVGDHATNRINTIFYGKNGQTDGKETYTYDEMGNIVSVNKNGVQKKKYGYDKLGRLTFEKNIDKNEEICYTYDDKGNIETKSINGSVKEYKYEEGTDRLIGYEEEKFEYDEIGNPLKYCELTLTWEKGRRLKSASNGSESVTYTYDAFGMRKSKTAGGTETSYVYEKGKLTREIRGSEKIDYLYGEDGIIGIKIGGEKYLYRKNVFGDVTEIYNEAGTLVGKYNYNAFGECEIEKDEGGIAEKNAIRYRGYYYDEETGFYYLKTRYYDPEIGRFITIDDTSYLDPDSVNGLNLYAYCGNNPVMNVDPEGTSWWSNFWNSTFGKVFGTILVIGAIIGLSILTAGVGGFITTALGGGLWAAVAGGAVGGAISGLIFGAGFSIGLQGITNGYGEIDWEQVSEDALTGMISGAIAGGVLGGLKQLISIEKVASRLSGLKNAQIKFDKAANILKNTPMSFKGGVMSTERIVAQLAFNSASAGLGFAQSLNTIIKLVVTGLYQIGQFGLKQFSGYVIKGWI